ncbi:MAG: amidohydrolase family protein [Chloroflexota bacterium]
MTEKLDVVVKNVRVVRPNKTAVDLLDLGIKDGKYARISPNIPAEDANEVVNAENLLGFPGLTDAHMHVGIYNPLEVDAVSESKAAAMGGVTTALTYFRTGRLYLQKAGPYRDFFPEVLAKSEGNYWVDYAYHLAPISKEHIDEMEFIATELGVPSFKIFMFYGGYGLHGKTSKPNDFLMIDNDESYDLAHFEFVMRGAQRVMAAHPEIADSISVSLHCEVADILNAYTKIAEADPSLTGLYAYHHARPPHSEGQAIFIASYLAYETDCMNINLLHLSSRKALEAAIMMSTLFPHLNIKREVTVGHLLIDIDSDAWPYAKFNPPIRPRKDVEYLWEAVLDRKVDWIASDHVCGSAEEKVVHEDRDDIWLAERGFGGTEYLLSGVFSEGSKRGMSYNHMAELLCWNPAQRYGLLNKGDIAVGYDADLVLLDPNETFTVRAEESESKQGYTPFEGRELTGKVKRTILRGNTVYHKGSVVGEATGQFIHRPSAKPAPPGI